MATAWVTNTAGLLTSQADRNGSNEIIQPTFVNDSPRASLALRLTDVRPSYTRATLATSENLVSGFLTIDQLKAIFTY